MSLTFHVLPDDASAIVLDLDAEGFSMRENSCLVRSVYAPRVERRREDVVASVEEEAPTLDAEAVAAACITSCQTLQYAYVRARVAVLAAGLNL